MKELLLPIKLLAFLIPPFFCYHEASAQITYASTNFASAGDTFIVTRVKLDSLGAANFGQTGANFTWNYSSLRPLIQTTDRYLGASNTGYRAPFVAACVEGGGAFTACNTQWGNLVNMGHKEMDSIKLGELKFGNLVHHYNKTTAILPVNVMGLTLNMNGSDIPMTVAYQRPDTMIRFPLTYNKRDTCISKYNIDLTGQGINFVYKSTARRINHVEGWGPLTTPFRNYTSTLKLRSTITNTDTVIINGNIIPVPSRVTLEFSWFELNTKRPVLKAVGNVASGVTVWNRIEYTDTARCFSPVAAFSSTPLVPYLNTASGTVTVNFNNNSINASHYNWNFDDTASGPLNRSTATHPARTFTKAGVYSVKLLSCNNKCQPQRCDSVTTPVTVYDSTNVKADFTFKPLQACTGDTVAFKNLSLNANSYLWSFGDNTTSTTQDPAKTYNNPGVYTISLIVINGSQRDTLTRKITITGSPEATITPPGNFTFCNGDSVYLTASGGMYYQWNNGSVDPVLKVKTAGAYFVKAFNNCGVSTSAPDTLSTLNYVTPAIAINSSQGSTVCNGATVNFITFAPYAGSNPVYQWRINSTDVGTNSTSFSTNTLRQNDTVYCLLTSNYQCRLSSNAISNKIIISVLTNARPSVSISASQSIICKGDNVTFFAYPVYGGTTPVYQWLVNNVNVGTNSSSYQSTTLNNGDVVRCKITSNYQCRTADTAISPAITMTVNQVQPAITITANPAGPVCPNTSVTFTATVTNGGSTPSFQWRRNLTNVGTNSSTFTIATLANNDSIRCILTSNAACAIPATATSNVIRMTVSNNLNPTITITPLPGDSICYGTDVTFNTQVTVAGTNPVYRWRVNGIDTGANLSSFVSAALEDSALVNCVMTSNASCANPATVTSNTVRMKVKPLLLPSIAIQTDTTTICEGASVLFTATTQNGGNQPIYEWIVNGQVDSAAVDTFYVISPFNGDAIRCRLTSNAVCASPAVVESLADTVTVLPSPFAEISISGPASVCSGGNVELSAPEGLKYEWNTGDTSRVIFVDSTAAVTVAVTDSNQCRSVSEPVDVFIYALPDSPVITRMADTLYSSNAVSYQWYRNDTILLNDTTFSLTLLQDGNYSVAIKDSNGCEARSTNFEVIGLGIYFQKDVVFATLNPNPNNGYFIMQFSDELPVRVMISDLTGRQVHEEIISSTTTPFNLTQLQVGIYLARVEWNGQHKILRFTVQ